LKAFWSIASAMLILTINGYLYHQFLHINEKSKENMQLTTLEVLRNHRASFAFGWLVQLGHSFDLDSKQ